MIALRVMVGAVHLIACFSFHLPLVALFYFVITQLCKHNVFVEFDDKFDKINFYSNQHGHATFFKLGVGTIVSVLVKCLRYLQFAN